MSIEQQRLRFSMGFHWNFTDTVSAFVARLLNFRSVCGDLLEWRTLFVDSMTALISITSIIIYYLSWLVVFVTLISITLYMYMNNQSNTYNEWLIINGFQYDIDSVSLRYRIHYPSIYNQTLIWSKFRQQIPIINIPITITRTNCSTDDLT